jgi:hypothetical protein
MSRHGRRPCARCVHCGEELGGPIGGGLFIHAHGLQRCQAAGVPYGHMGHPFRPCPPGDINPCEGYREGACDHVAADVETA